MPPFRFKPGDIAACFGTDRASRIISLGTWSPVAPAGLRLGPSHVALLCEPPVEWARDATISERDRSAPSDPSEAFPKNSVVGSTRSFIDSTTNQLAENGKLNTAGGRGWTERSEGNLGDWNNARLISNTDLSPQAENCIWIESTTMCRHPCLMRNEKVSGVQAHRPDARIADYTKAGGRVDIYRLSPIDRLSRDESRLLTMILINHFVQRNIDYDMGGALLSGTRVLKLSRILNSDLNEVFCSELVSAVAQRLGRLNRQNPTRHNPASLLRQLVRQGTYQKASSFKRSADELPIHPTGTVKQTSKTKDELAQFCGYEIGRI